MENRTMQVVLAKDEKILFPDATVYDIEQEQELNREVGRVPIEADYPGSYLADGKRWLRVARFFDEEGWFTL
ncbi:MAG TPA: hypothetical protein VJV03_01280 [Pyrinomonadaceae bacterium]|nr:hypothetical protein [Pyrinomonadaceae bacterium]